MKMFVFVAAIAFSIGIISCSSDNGASEEQISVYPSPAEEESDTATYNSIQGNLSLAEMAIEPNRVILTGLKEHRLVTLYKARLGTGTREVKKYYYYDGTRR